MESTVGSYMGSETLKDDKMFSMIYFIKHIHFQQSKFLHRIYKTRRPLSAHKRQLSQMGG